MKLKLETSHVECVRAVDTDIGKTYRILHVEDTFLRIGNAHENSEYPSDQYAAFLALSTCHLNYLPLGQILIKVVKEPEIIV